MTGPTDIPSTLPFPAPAEPPEARAARVAEIVHVAANLDLRRLPPGLRESAAALLGTWAEVYGASPVRLAGADGDDGEGGRA